MRTFRAKLSLAALRDNRPEFLDLRILSPTGCGASGFACHKGRRRRLKGLNTGGDENRKRPRNARGTAGKNESDASTPIPVSAHRRRTIGCSTEITLSGYIRYSELFGFDNSNSRFCAIVARIPVIIAVSGTLASRRLSNAFTNSKARVRPAPSW